MEGSRKDLIEHLEKEDRALYELHKRRHHPLRRHAYFGTLDDLKANSDVCALRTVSSIMKLRNMCNAPLPPSSGCDEEQVPDGEALLTSSHFITPIMSGRQLDSQCPPMRPVVVPSPVVPSQSSRLRSSMYTESDASSPSACEPVMMSHNDSVSDSMGSNILSAGASPSARILSPLPLYLYSSNHSESGCSCSQCSTERILQKSVSNIDMINSPREYPPHCTYLRNLSPPFRYKAGTACTGKILRDSTDFREAMQANVGSSRDVETVSPHYEAFGSPCEAPISPIGGSMSPSSPASSDNNVCAIAQQMEVSHISPGGNAACVASLTPLVRPQSTGVPPNFEGSFSTPRKGSSKASDIVGISVEDGAPLEGDNALVTADISGGSDLSESPLATMNHSRSCVPNFHDDSGVADNITEPQHSELSSSGVKEPPPLSLVEQGSHDSNACLSNSSAIITSADISPVGEVSLSSARGYASEDDVETSVITASTPAAGAAAVQEISVTETHATSPPLTSALSPTGSRRASTDCLTDVITPSPNASEIRLHGVVTSSIQDDSFVKTGDEVEASPTLMVSDAVDLQPCIKHQVSSDNILNSTNEKDPPAPPSDDMHEDTLADAGTAQVSETVATDTERSEDSKDSPPCVKSLSSAGDVDTRSVSRACSVSGMSSQSEVSPSCTTDDNLMDQNAFVSLRTRMESNVPPSLDVVHHHEDSNVESATDDVGSQYGTEATPNCLDDAPTDTLLPTSDTACPSVPPLELPLRSSITSEKPLAINSSRASSSDNISDAGPLANDIHETCLDAPSPSGRPADAVKSLNADTDGGAPAESYSNNDVDPVVALDEIPETPKDTERSDSDGRIMKEPLQSPPSSGLTGSFSVIPPELDDATPSSTPGGTVVDNVSVADSQDTPQEEVVLGSPRVPSVARAALLPPDVACGTDMPGLCTKVTSECLTDSDVEYCDSAGMLDTARSNACEISVLHASNLGGSPDLLPGGGDAQLVPEAGSDNASYQDYGSSDDSRDDAPTVEAPHLEGDTKQSESDYSRSSSVSSISPPKSMCMEATLSEGAAIEPTMVDSEVTSEVSPRITNVVSSPTDVHATEVSPELPERAIGVCSAAATDTVDQVDDAPYLVSDSPLSCLSSSGLDGSVSINSGSEDSFGSDTEDHGDLVSEDDAPPSVKRVPTKKMKVVCFDLPDDDPQCNMSLGGSSSDVHIDEAVRSQSDTDSSDVDESPLSRSPRENEGVSTAVCDTVHSDSVSNDGTLAAADASAPPSEEASAYSSYLMKLF